MTCSAYTYTVASAFILCVALDIDAECVPRGALGVFNAISTKAIDCDWSASNCAHRRGKDDREIR